MKGPEQFSPEPNPYEDNQQETGGFQEVEERGGVENAEWQPEMVEGVEGNEPAADSSENQQGSPEGIRDEDGNLSMTRRYALRAALATLGGLALAPLAEHSEASFGDGRRLESDGPTPAYSIDTKTAHLETIHNIKTPGFERFDLVREDINGIKHESGTFIAIDPKAGGKAVFLTKAKDPQYFNPKIQYEKIAGHYEAHGESVAFGCAAAFKDAAGNIEGVTIENGADVGEADFHKGHDGLVVFDKKGQPRIYKVNPDPHFSEIKDPNQFKINAANGKWSCFQQKLVIDGGRAHFASGRNGAIRTRFFVEREVPVDPHDPAKGTTPTYGIVDFTEKMTIDDAIDLLTKLNLDPNTGTHKSRIKRAVYLDTGAYSHAVMSEQVVDPKTRRVRRKIENISDPRYNKTQAITDQNERGFTNALVFVGPKK